MGGPADAARPDHGVLLPCPAPSAGGFVDGMADALSFCVKPDEVNRHNAELGGLLRDCDTLADQIAQLGRAAASGAGCGGDTRDQTLVTCLDEIARAMRQTTAAVAATGNLGVRCAGMYQRADTRLASGYGTLTGGLPVGAFGPGVAP